MRDVADGSAFDRLMQKSAAAAPLEEAAARTSRYAVALHEALTTHKRYVGPAAAAADQLGKYAGIEIAERSEVVPVATISDWGDVRGDYDQVLLNVAGVPVAYNPTRPGPSGTPRGVLFVYDPNSGHQPGSVTAGTRASTGGAEFDNAYEPTRVFEGKPQRSGVLVPGSYVRFEDYDPARADEWVGALVRPWTEHGNGPVEPADQLDTARAWAKTRRRVAVVSFEDACAIGSSAYSDAIRVRESAVADGLDEHTGKVWGGVRIGPFTDGFDDEAEVVNRTYRGLKATGDVFAEINQQFRERTDLNPLFGFVEEPEATTGTEPDAALGGP